MDNNQRGFIAWVMSHRKQLVIAGISAVAIIGIILGLKNKEAIAELWVSLKNSIKMVPVKDAATTPTTRAATPVLEVQEVPRSYTSPQTPFDVSQHIRTMSGGRQHSAEKAAEAAALGISLLSNQTLVDTYTKCAA